MDVLGRIKFESNMEILTGECISRAKEMCSRGLPVEANQYTALAHYILSDVTNNNELDRARVIMLTVDFVNKLVEKL